MLPMRMLLKELGPWRDISEKSVVRPTYSYMGEYKISDKVMTDIIECIRNESPDVMEILRTGVVPMQEGIDIFVIANFRYGADLPESAGKFQKDVVQKIEEMTSFNVNKLDLEVKDII